MRRLLTKNPPNATPLKKAQISQYLGIPARNINRILEQLRGYGYETPRGEISLEVLGIVLLAYDRIQGGTRIKDAIEHVLYLGGNTITHNRYISSNKLGELLGLSRQGLDRYEEELWLKDTASHGKISIGAAGLIARTRYKVLLGSTISEAADEARYLAPAHEVNRSL